MVKRRDHAKKVATKPSPSKDPPPPFSEAPADLQPFLGGLDPSKVYITHVDTIPRAFKRRIFTVPVLLNLSIAALLAWRAYVALPAYLAILFSILGYNTSAVVNKDALSWAQLAWIAVKRAAMFIFDFTLFRIVGPWPVSFFLEKPANPFTWRWNIGFRDQEIYVRESRKWGGQDLLEGVRKGQESPFFKVRVLPAVDTKYLGSKTGYLMMDKYWDLDFKNMTDAHALVDHDTMKISNFRTSVLAHSEGRGWLAWNIQGRNNVSEEEEEEDARKTIVAFKDQLTLLGKESLFFRWIELIQYESSRPGELDAAKQANAVEKARALFESEGIMFDEFLDSVGGVRDIPGLELET